MRKVSSFGPWRSSRIDMHRVILLVEPDVKQAKRTARLLTGAGYDAIIVPGVDRALGTLCHTPPDALLLSNHLPIAQRERLRASLAAVPDMLVVELGAGLRSNGLYACSLRTLIQTLNVLFQASAASRYAPSSVASDQRPPS